MHAIISTHKLKAKDKALGILSTVLLGKFKQTPSSNPPPRHKDIAPCPHNHLLGIILEVDTNLSSWVEQ